MGSETSKMLGLCRRIRAYMAAVDQTLVEIEHELEKDQAPTEPRKRRNLKQERIEFYERAYAIGKFTKPKNLKRQKRN